MVSIKSLTRRTAPGAPALLLSLRGKSKPHQLPPLRLVLVHRFFVLHNPVDETDAIGIRRRDSLGNHHHASSRHGVHLVSLALHLPDALQHKGRYHGRNDAQTHLGEEEPCIGQRDDVLHDTPTPPPMHPPFTKARVGMRSLSQRSSMVLSFIESALIWSWFILES